MTKYKMTQEGFIRLTKKSLVMMLAFLIVFTGSGLYMLFFNPKQVSAAWYAVRPEFVEGMITGAIRL